MAECGKLPRTLEGGSDDLFRNECTQCRADGSKQEASHFCQDCKLFLCQTCGRYHIRYMRRHTLLGAELLTQSQKSLPTVSPVPVVAKCHYHPDRDIEMYCGTHDMVYCSLCIAKKHRSCPNVKEIGDVAHAIQFSTLQSLVADITQVKKQLHAAKLKKSNDLQVIKKKKADLLQEISAVRKRMNKHLDALEEKIIAELDAEQKMLEKKINADIIVVDDLIIASEKGKPDLTSNYDENQMFITEKLTRVVLADANRFMKEVKVSEHPTLKFGLNVALCDAILKSDRMGNIIRSETKPKPVPRRNFTGTHGTSISTYVCSDKNERFINDMCQLPDGTILLIDSMNNKLKRLDDELKVKDFCSLKARPMGLCSVSHTEVAVRLEDKTIQFISVGLSLCYQRKISINDLNNANDGLACCTEQFWIPGDEAVYIYSFSGTLVKKVGTDFQDREIFPNCNPRHITVNNDETKVYVAAWDDRVVVFNTDGDVIKELRDQLLNGAQSVCVTEDGTVLVAGCYSSRVVTFDRDGNSLGAIDFHKSSGVAYFFCDAKSLCYDRQKRRLLVGCLHNSTTRNNSCYSYLLNQTLANV